MKNGIFNILVLFAVALLAQEVQSNTVQLVSSNVDQILGGHEFVIVNFYADWCRFSNMLSPIFEDASKAVKREFPDEGKVAFAKVDCDKETDIAKKYHVSKYPTLKMFRYGQLTKREYRGQRSVAAISQFLREQLKNPVVTLNDLEESDKFDRKKRHVIGMFEHSEGEDVKIFNKVASILRDDCNFYLAMGPVSEDHRIAGNKVVYKPPGENSQEMSYSGRLADYQTMLAWSTDKCIPLVREITFENAEELTEEGLPFLILFHHPDDTETPAKFTKQISLELLPEKNSVNFLTADGTKFTHPLYHLGKTSKDLPVLAIDSFKHMYLWKNNAKTDLETPGLVKTFIADLHSGKLHREFHNGPDPTTAQPKAIAGKAGHVQNNPDESKDPTDPPESTFKKLQPSENRYTILHKDEL